MAKSSFSVESLLDLGPKASTASQKSPQGRHFLLGSQVPYLSFAVFLQETPRIAIETSPRSPVSTRVAPSPASPTRTRYYRPFGLEINICHVKLTFHLENPENRICDFEIEIKTFNLW